MDTTRAAAELGWRPRRSADDALVELLAGIQHGEGVETPPLSPDSGGLARVRELASGVGSREL
jgi:UDP-glucose 4-epimerase